MAHKKDEFQSKEPDTKKTDPDREKKPKNSNPYDNLALIWGVLRRYATPQHPMSAKDVYSKLSSKEEYPSQRTVATLLEERQELMGQLFGRRVCPSLSSVQKILRRQGMSTAPFPNASTITCVAKTTNGSVDYEDYCIRKAAAAGLAELPDEGKPTRYYYLESPLTGGEWQIFKDLVRFSPWISPQQTEKFLSMLRHLSPSKEVGDDVYYHFKREHTGQFALIHTLHQAIAQHQSVNLCYGTHVLQYDLKHTLTPHLVPRERHSELQIAPLSLLWANGLYYLLAQHEKYGTMHLRVDRILSVSLTGESFTPPQGFSVAEHRDRSPVMYGGTPQLVRFTCPKTMVNTVMDFFGTTPQYKLLEDQIEVRISASLGGVKLFALQYVGTVEVLEPLSLREDISKALQKGLEQYQET